MPLTPGARLGPFEIVAPLGAGGMGEVFRARDPRLGRDVAIKALPDAFAQDPERLARFEREARLLASLNHPNVAGIHGLEEAEGHRYLVLEFVEGETLAARLERGALPVDETLDVCRQVAAGVEAAHEAGVVHRDLKPGNVMLRPDGTVKVLDFGLARSGAPERPGSEPNLSASPTMTAAATTAGVILGTAAYMSPEQARGRLVDKRSDVWSFGCVLYECLTGRQAFRGETVSDTIAAILKTDPDLSRLPADSPPRVRELLGRCLTRDVKERLRDIGEARVALGASDATAAAPAAGSPARGRGVPTGLAVGAALALAAVAVVVTLVMIPKPAPAPLRRLDLAADQVGVDWFFGPRLSPDGRSIAYLSGSRILVRRLDQLESRSVTDVDGNVAFCWSPDSRELAFENRKQFWRVAASGGTPVAICAIPGTGSSIGVTWSAHGLLAFSVWRGGIWSVPAVGGAPKLLVDIDAGRIVDYHSPTWLPNGDLMYVVHWSGERDSTGASRPDVEVFTGGKRRPVGGTLGNESQPVVTSSGQLLYVRRGASNGIWTVRYDPGGRRIVGEPRLVAPGAVSVSASEDGSLLYAEGNAFYRPRELLWVDRAGKEISATGTAYPGLSDVCLSPDGRKVAFSAVAEGQRDIWVRDLVRGVDTRITFSASDDYMPHWIGPDRVSYVEEGRSSGMETRIRSANADGSGADRVLAPPTGSSAQDAFFVPDGRTALRIVDEAGHGRLRRAAVQADGTLGPPEPFVRFSPEPDVNGVGAGGGGATLSPDGRLVAYTSRDEEPRVFLTRFPGGEGPWQVSSEGGRLTAWARGTGSLYYVAGSGPTRRWLAEVTIDSSQDPPVGRTTTLFDLQPLRTQWTDEWSYDVGADGRRFLVTRDAPGTEAPRTRLVLVENWESALAPAASR